MVSTAIRDNSGGTQLYDTYFLYEGFKQIHRPFQFSLLIRMKLSTSANQFSYSQHLSYSVFKEEEGWIISSNSLAM